MTARLAPLLLLAACGGAAAPAPRPDDAIARGARWLWDRQGEDGGWHSTTYGLLRSGQSLTPFVLDLLLRVPEDLAPRPEGGVARAVAFLRAHVDAEGALGRAGEIADYPSYATACGALALLRAGEDADALLDWLEGQQLADGLGWTREHPAYGAWGMGGPPRRPPDPGHLDLSMTRHVAEALAAGGRTGCLARTRVFLARCRNPDGGYLFSTVVEGANKAGPRRSYGTTTADGLLVQLALGERPDPSWLVAHHRPDAVPGSTLEPRWSTAMLFYYRAAAATVLARLGVAEAPPGRDWRAELGDALRAEQRADGSWKNGDVVMKEDDPLIATRFALEALLALR